MSIVVVGSIAFDSIKTPFGTCEQALGGAANYFSVAASFFTKVRLVGVVGDDFPKEHLSFLSDRSIDTDGVKYASGKTFHWKGQYGFDLNEAKTLQTDLNVFANFSPELPPHYRHSQTVFLANIDPSLQIQVLEQVKNPSLTALDTMNFWIEGKTAVLKEAIGKVDILFINDAEIRQLAQECHLLKAVRSVQMLGPKTVVVKRGEYGAMLFHGDNLFFVPAFPLETLYDPTGAGDTFAGGFLGWLDARGGGINFDALKEAMLVGTVLSSYVIESFSFDRLRNLTLQEIESRCHTLQLISAGPSYIRIKQ